MPFIPHTSEDEREILKHLGIKRKEELFSHIPDEIKLRRDLLLPPPLSELEIEKELIKIASLNRTVRDYVSFLGGGSYDHWIPATVEALLSRGEIFSPYTPYQPEASQGTLTMLFEYQTMMCELFQMEVSNASVYDGATALAEACLMALRITKRDKVLLSSAIHPEYRKVVRAYMESAGFGVEELSFDQKGRTNLNELESKNLSEFGAIAIQTPNFFGVIEDINAFKNLKKDGALLIACVAEPLSLGVIAPPGSYGADIAVGEGGSLGMHLSFGGPYLGIFTSRMKYLRNMPGRIVGETIDREGKRGFVLTLATREQHIRRAKATSNICTNHNMCAIAATIYLASLGKRGFKKVSEINLKKTHFLAKEIAKRGFELLFPSPFFNEFAIRIKNPEKVIERGLNEGFIAGLSLGKFYAELKDALLITVTEMHSLNDLSRFASFLEGMKDG
ncbi:MAG: aminomethyl-transferring glycine dehydrogenase subunit GcvPA [Synergistetes bacterium]|nr:aminomethyl-transferring glycine dehydrogenase subunit GcvPA [Synergistota bacterium]